MSNERSIDFIVNPTSGRGKALAFAESTARSLRSRGVDVRIHPTAKAGDAESIARSLCLDGPPPSIIVPCGGDGTIQQVINGVAPLRERIAPHMPAIGLAPAGRCNDFARIFSISRKPESVARTLLSGKRLAVDLGRVNDRYFCTVATVGVDADISEFVDKQNLPIRGTPAYVWAALRVLATYKGRPIRITGTRHPFDDKVFLASCANTSSYGGSIKIVPHADATDGHLDLCRIDHMGLWRSLYLLARVLFGGRHVSMREVHFDTVTSVRFECNPQGTIWADGEAIGTTPADIAVVPQAIDVIVPAESAAASDSRIRGSWS